MSSCSIVASPGRVPTDTQPESKIGHLFLHSAAHDPARFCERQRDVGRALDLFAEAAKHHCLPATGQLGCIAGRGLYGCRQGPFQGTDWIEERCRHLEPGAQAGSRSVTLKLPLRGFCCKTGTPLCAFMPLCALPASDWCRGLVSEKKVCYFMRNTIF